MKYLFALALTLLLTVGQCFAAVYQVKQSTTAYPLIFFMTDSADHVSGKTGLTCTVTISKNGGSFASPSGAVTEIGNGWYKVAGNATDTATLGLLALHATASGADPTDSSYEVVAVDPQSATGFMSSVNVGSWLGTTVATPTVAGVPEVDPTHWNGTAVATPDTAGYPKVTVKDGTGTGEIDTASGKVIVDGAGSSGLLTAQNIEDEVLDAALSGHTTAGTVAKAISDILDDTGTSGVQIPSGEITSTTFGAGAIDANAIAANAISAAKTAADFLAEVNAEVVDALATDTYAEPGQGTPAATASLSAKINYLYKAWRNKKDTDGSVTNYYNDAGDTVDHKASVGESAGTTTVGEVATGP